MNGCLTLASYTGWQLSELKELSVDELVEWIDMIPKQQPGHHG